MTTLSLKESGSLFLAVGSAPAFRLWEFLDNTIEAPMSSQVFSAPNGIVQAVDTEVSAWVKRIENRFQPPMAPLSPFEYETKKTVDVVEFKYKTGDLSYDRIMFTKSTGLHVLDPRPAYKVSWGDWRKWYMAYQEFLSAVRGF